MELNPLQWTILATLFTWGATAFGAASVFVFQDISRKTMNGMLGFASGVMIAASFWSLLAPSIEMSEELGWVSWFPPVTGFLLGGFFLWCVDKTLPHLHSGDGDQPEGIRTNWRRSFLLVFAITLHNIPEGLAVGVAFGAVGFGIESASIAAAFSLAVGIGIQNIPEGAAISLPLRREGLSRIKCFWYGQISGFVEPVAAIIGCLVVSVIQGILPFALAFAAGAMIYVVVEELIPTSQEDRNSDTGTIGAIIGFAIMMLLDVALG
ncbi:MAG: ZIP family metal transporter [Planctomycetaceae bacterium]|jgi:ZIP family zinc transporter|nr:ZIP family metal transporter [Planctomycetaceae bacterium]